MTRNTNRNGLNSAPRWIVIFLGVYLIVHLLVLYLWNAAGQVVSLQAPSDNTSALSVTAMAAFDLWLCLAVLRRFPPGAPLRSTWLLLTLAAAARASSGVLAHLLGTDWPLNPLVWTGHAKSGLVEQIRLAAQFSGGPLRFALLTVAMAALLRVLRKSGFRARPGSVDWAVCGILCFFTLCRYTEAGTQSLAGRQVSLEAWLSLAGLPILCVLSLEAMLLRQSIARMGSGLVTRGWLAMVCGILFTGAAEIVSWVIPHYAQMQPLAMLGALIQLPIAAAFALAPACQLAAQRRAIQPAAGPPEDLPHRVPALAR